MKKRAIIFLGTCLIFFGCSTSKKENVELVSLQLIDRNGFNETISSKDRLNTYKNTDFLQPQPYDKVVRLFRKSSKGVYSAVTSYHENGQIAQYLEVESGRAHGEYKEWHTNGQMKISAHVIEGLGDISQDAMGSWVFDKESIAYDDKGHVMARVFYDKGELCKEALYYHKNGAVRKRVPYVKNQIHGEEILYNDKEEKIGFIHYKHGLKNGLSEYSGSDFCPRFYEQYEEGKLMSAIYYNFQGEVVSQIINGFGLQTLYIEGVLDKQLEFKNGMQEGKVYEYLNGSVLLSLYNLKEGEKHGEEWIYYTNTKVSKQPKICLNWYEGKLQGRVKTWYANGNLESEREMYGNKKNGPSTAWYLDGSIMLIEEYENDLLVKGTYMRKKEKAPISYIENGNGVATLYDKEGHFLRKVTYQRGLPVEE